LGGGDLQREDFSVDREDCCEGRKEFIPFMTSAEWPAPINSQRL